MVEATQAWFGTDLRRALAAWRRFTWLPVVSVAIGAAFLLPDYLWPLGLPILVLQAGWVGTERICYLRAFRGKPVHVGELWRLTRSFLIRYSTLGVAVGIPMVVVLRVLSLTGVIPGVPWEGSRGPSSFIALYASWVIVDVALTFVTPALAFTTRKVRRAFRIGLRMIRQEWPSCAWYVLVPPLAALFVAQTFTRLRDVGIAGQIVVSALATLLNLWFKGATAASISVEKTSGTMAPHSSRETRVAGNSPQRDTRRVCSCGRTRRRTSAESEILGPYSRASSN